MKLVDKMKKIKGSLRIDTDKKITSDKGKNPEFSTVYNEKDNNRPVITATKKDGDILESSATQDAQESGEYEKAMKKIGAKKEDIKFTSPSMAVAQAAVQSKKTNKEKDLDNDKESKKESLVKNYDIKREGSTLKYTKIDLQNAEGAKIPKWKQMLQEKNKAKSAKFQYDQGKNRKISPGVVLKSEHEETSEKLEKDVVDIHSKKVIGETGVKPGTGKPNSFENDLFNWRDVKTSKGKQFLKDNYKKPIHIHTSSDLIAHDEYMHHINPGSTIHLHSQQSGPDLKDVKEGFPSNKRLLDAANKLKAAGYKVELHGFPSKDGPTPVKPSLKLMKSLKKLFKNMNSGDDMSLGQNSKMAALSGGIKTAFGTPSPSTPPPAPAPNSGSLGGNITGSIQRMGKADGDEADRSRIRKMIDDMKNRKKTSQSKQSGVSREDKIRAALKRHGRGIISTKDKKFENKPFVNKPMPKKDVVPLENVMGPKETYESSIKNSDNKNNASKLRHIHTIDLDDGSALQVFKATRPEHSSLTGAHYYADPGEKFHNPEKWSHKLHNIIEGAIKDNFPRVIIHASEHSPEIMKTKKEGNVYTQPMDESGNIKRKLTLVKSDLSAKNTVGKFLKMKDVLKKAKIQIIGG